ncbi:MAG: S-adenosylmethionine:tRNA ribosyltransferase-isomerase [Bacteroidia bacterium]|nr:S-adenosylmethionine:tRNA ribosyltransferase-isomerase [Bacteroidia bacterium]
MKGIELNDYDYDLPSERIAQYPVNERDMSKLLIYKENNISKDIFRNIDDYLPSDSLLVFNNTRVIRARILFRKETGAAIEVFCLEPLSPFDYELSFSSIEPVEWKCIIGNLKKWKYGKIMTPFVFSGKEYKLTAEKLKPEGDAWQILFTWNYSGLSFGEVIEATGHIPLPPYINREDEAEDIIRYQTVYSRIKGSVAAPTAGLHFTNNILEKLDKKGIKSVEVTLHVGAGTFQPVKSTNISSHEMHCEHFFVTAKTIELLLENQGKIIPVGTTSVRTLESLFWLGVKIINDPLDFRSDLSLGQWEAYDLETTVTVKESMEALLNHLRERNLSNLHALTSIIIIPGYDFRMINGMITNFHQPRSTLLLLISAWTGIKWKEIYTFALENDFRFLSYGDSSLLFKKCTLFGLFFLLHLENYFLFIN